MSSYIPRGLLDTDSNKNTDPTYRMSMLPFGTYANANGQGEHLGLAVPGMVQEPIDALMRLMGTPSAPGTLWNGPDYGRNADDMRTLIATMFGGGSGGALGMGEGALASGPLARAALGDAAEQAAKPGFDVWHGSPHDFDKFDISKIDSGEGAQAYGHGLYFAEAPGVAKGYQSDLSKRMMPSLRIDPDVPPHIADVARDMQGSQRYTSNDQLKNRDISYPPEIDSELQKYLDAGKIGLDQSPGYLYQARIHADPEHFLDWDKPLSEQSEHVRSLLQQSSPSQGLNHAGPRNPELPSSLVQGPSGFDQTNGFIKAPSGRVVGQGVGSVVNDGKIGNSVVGLNPVNMMDVLRGQQLAPKMLGHDPSMLLSELPIEGRNNVPLGVNGAFPAERSVASAAAEGPGISGDVIGRSMKGFPALTADELRHMTVPQLMERLGSGDTATEALRNQGVSGIKYLDAGSRGAGDGSRNYVVFDHNLVDTLHKWQGDKQLYSDNMPSLWNPLFANPDPDNR
jgi:hypothetical protein